jgi:hypothetical protein
MLVMQRYATRHETLSCSDVIAAAACAVYRRRVFRQVRFAFELRPSGLMIIFSFFFSRLAGSRPSSLNLNCPFDFI